MMLLSTLLATLFIPRLTSAFSFSLNSTGLSQCGTASVSWSGGTAPYNLTIIPAFDYPSVVSIPSSAYNSDTGIGQYSWTVDYPKDTRFVAMMSDNSGTGTGGVSPLYTVGSGSGSCTMRSTKTDFLFYLNETSLTQCDPIQVYWDATAYSPVTILGAIPGGQVFQLVSAGSNTRSLVWDTNIASGTEVILAAFDQGPNMQGGSSALLKIGGSADSSCLDESSPSSTTAGGPTATGTKTGGGGGGGVKTVTAVTTETTAPKGAAGLTTGAIVGIAVSAVIVVLALQFALFWFCCRRQVKALIYHRREMRGKEVKPGGEVDLGLATRYSETEDDNMHIHGHEHDASFAAPPGSRYSAARSGDDQLDAASTISPFIDTSNSASGKLAAPSPLRPGFGFSAGAGGPQSTYGHYGGDLDPPRAPGTYGSSHGRNDSIGHSLNDIDLTPSPPLSSGVFSSSSNLLGYNFPAEGRNGNGNGNGGRTNAAAGPGMTKAQMAAALSASNPDPSSMRRGNAQQAGQAGDQNAGPFGTSSPPLDAPIGGFRRHEDAGAVPLPTSQGGGNDVEDLPPMYSDAWGRDQQREQEQGQGR